jgi:ParB family chromosome partitioning protein
MPDKSGQMFELPRKSSLVADLFTTQEQRDNDKREKVLDAPLDLIDDFPDHPFQVRRDDAMTAMVDSVKAVGIQTPAIARQKEDGRYELISGHRRKLAAILAGLETMPIIVRELSRDEAIIAMVDANLQRETILPSEKALSYKMKMDALNRQGERTDLTFSPSVNYKCRKNKGYRRFCVIRVSFGHFSTALNSLKLREKNAFYGCRNCRMFLFRV